MYMKEKKKLDSPSVSWSVKLTDRNSETCLTGRPKELLAEGITHQVREGQKFLSH